MTYTLTYEQALDGLQRAVAEKGADYVDPDSQCCYFEYEEEDNEKSTLVPRCIVGHVFSYNGITDVAALTVSGLIDEEELSVDSRTAKLLGVAQSHQDGVDHLDRLPWGEAVKKAIEAVEAWDAEQQEARV